MLRIKNLHTYYGPIRALYNVSLHVRVGEIVSLIGANGAGKTTMLNTISGLIPAAKGEITFEDIKINGLPPEKITDYLGLMGDSSRFLRDGRYLLR